MATCEVCGTEISGTTLLECGECGYDYCRKHYHGHDCDPIEESLDEETENQPTQDIESQRTQEHNGRSLVPQIGYLLAVFAAILGSLYLIISIDAIFVGGGLQKVIHLTVSGTLFSVATFLLVASYILAK